MLQARARTQVVVADAMVEGVHFDRALSPAEAIGGKLVAVNVSDIAAMGGVPDYALMTASMPSSLPFAWARAMFGGVARTARRYGLVVVGGDVTGSPGPVTLSLTMIGTLAGEHPVRRDCALVGDTVYVTGPLGASALGLRQLRGSPAASGPPVDAYRIPEARAREGAVLGAWGQCHAMMDLSDGLATDAGRLARASGVTIELDLAQIPAFDDELTLALYGGEDYELLFTCIDKPPCYALPIGRVLEGEPELLWTRGGVATEPPPPDGALFRHFRDPE